MNFNLFTIFKEILFLNLNKFIIKKGFLKYFFLNHLNFYLKECLKIFHLHCFSTTQLIFL